MNETEDKACVNHDLTRAELSCMTAIMFAKGMQADEILVELSKQNVSIETAKSIIKKAENFDQSELRKGAQNTMLLGVFFIATGAIIFLMKQAHPPNQWFFLASALLAVWGIRMLIKGLMKIINA